MNVYEARHKNALKWANKVNSLLSSGYLVFSGGRKFWGFYVDEDGSIYEETEKMEGHIIRYIWYLNDPTMDNGAHIKISDYNKRFNDFSYIPPKHIKKVRVDKSKVFLLGYR